MKKLAFLVLAALALSQAASHAQAARTWVSGVGDDANPGSRTAPCKTFAGAVGETAAGGEINTIDPGSFGAVTITKSLTIDGGSLTAAILGAGTNAIIINAGPTDVITLRNLEINGFNTGLNGIRIVQAAEVNIENCVISQFTLLGIDINPATDCRVSVKNTTIRKCAQGAVHSHPSGTANAFVTVKGSALRTSLFGFKGEARTKATIEDCEIAGNTGDGVVSEAPTATPTAEVNVNACIVSDNVGSGLLTTGAGAILWGADTTVTTNGIGLYRPTGKLYTFGDCRVRLNTNDGHAPSAVLNAK